MLCLFQRSIFIKDATTLYENAMYMLIIHYELETIDEGIIKNIGIQKQWFYNGF